MQLDIGQRFYTLVRLIALVQLDKVQGFHIGKADSLGSVGQGSGVPHW